jgi:hypothetical protein
MSGYLNKLLSSGEIEAAEQGITEDGRAGRTEAAWQKSQPLRKVQHHQPEAAKALLRIIHQRWLPRESALEVLSEIANSHWEDASMLAELGECLEAARDIDNLNAAPPADPVFYTAVERLGAFAADYAGLPGEEAILRGLATAARMLARQYDDRGDHHVGSVCAFEY